MSCLYVHRCLRYPGSRTTTVNLLACSSLGLMYIQLLLSGHIHVEDLSYNNTHTQEHIPPTNITFNTTNTA